MIPDANVNDLHLTREVREAVADGRFHVWAVDTVESGLELLTGLPAGSWADEAWAPGDGVYARCQERLEEMARQMRNAGKEAKDDGGGNDDANGQPNEDETKPAR